MSTLPLNATLSSSQCQVSADDHGALQKAPYGPTVINQSAPYCPVVEKADAFEIPLRVMDSLNISVSPDPSNVECSVSRDMGRDADGAINQPGVSATASGLRRNIKPESSSSAHLDYLPKNSYTSGGVNSNPPASDLSVINANAESLSSNLRPSAVGTSRDLPARGCQPSPLDEDCGNNLDKSAANNDNKRGQFKPLNTQSPNGHSSTNCAPQAQFYGGAACEMQEPLMYPAPEFNDRFYSPPPSYSHPLRTQYSEPHMASRDSYPEKLHRQQSVPCRADDTRRPPQGLYRHESYHSYHQQFLNPHTHSPGQV